MTQRIINHTYCSLEVHDSLGMRNLGRQEGEGEGLKRTWRGHREDMKVMQKSHGEDSGNTERTQRGHGQDVKSSEPGHVLLQM